MGVVRHTVQLIFAILLSTCYNITKHILCDEKTGLPVRILTRFWLGLTAAALTGCFLVIVPLSSCDGWHRFVWWSWNRTRATADNAAKV